MTLREYLGRGVPLMGGVIGGGLDAYLLNKLADHVRTEFPVKATVTTLPPA